MRTALLLSPRFLCQAACAALLCTVAPGKDSQTKCPPPVAAKDSSGKSETTPDSRDEATALREFKAEDEKFKSWSRTKAKEIGKGYAAMFNIMREFSSLAAKVRTDGLPADLAASYKELITALGKMAAFFKNAPADDEGMQKWMREKSGDPAAKKEYLELMAGFKKALDHYVETAAKFGIKVEGWRLGGSEGEPRDEVDALLEFKTEMKTIMEWSRKELRAANKNPVAMMRVSIAMAEKLAQVRTDGLPADLGKEMEQMKDILGRVMSPLKEIPEKDEDVAPWMAGKLKSNPGFINQMDLAGKESVELGRKLDKTAAKYGIEGLNFGGPAAAAGKDGTKPESPGKE